MKLAFIENATRDQMSKLGELLVHAFQEGNLPSNETDSFTLEIDDNPAVYVQSNSEATCFDVAILGKTIDDICDEQEPQEQAMHIRFNIPELPRCTLTNCNQFKGGKEYKPYPTADYTNIGYDEKDLSSALFKALVEIAADAWEAECERYVEKNGDVGTCVSGAGIAIHYRKQKCRKYERKLILRPPSSSMQGASTWEHCVEQIVDWLKAHGIECFYHCGYMD